MFYSLRILRINKYAQGALSKTITSLFYLRHLPVKLFIPSRSNSHLRPGTRNDIQTNNQVDSAWHLPGLHDPSIPLERVKHPGRGGRNLSQRYKLLERSLLGKKELRREIDEMSEMVSNLEKGGYGSEADTTGMVQTSRRPDVSQKRGHEHVMFAGFVVPEKPKPPEPDGMCCKFVFVCLFFHLFFVLI